MAERPKLVEIKQTPFSPEDFDRAVSEWHWELAEMKVLKDLVARDYVKVDTFRAGKYRQDIIHIRSDEKFDKEADAFPIETLPYAFRKMIETARVWGQAKANILTWLSTESDATRGPGDIGYLCGESVSNAIFRKDEVTLQLTGSAPYISSAYLGRDETGWIVMGRDPRFPDIKITKP